MHVGYPSGMHQYYTTHRIVDGKWEIRVWIYEHEEPVSSKLDCPDLRNLINSHYDCEPLELAKVIMDNLLHCERVHVLQITGAGVYVER